MRKAEEDVVQLFNDGKPAMLDTSAETEILEIIEAGQGLFKITGVTEVNNANLLAEVFGTCTYTVLPGSDDPTRYTPVTYSPVRSEVRP